MPVTSSTTLWPAIKTYGLSLIYSTEWNANFNRYGVFPYVLGTAVSSLIAMVLALPLGVLIAIFLSEDFLPYTLRQVFRFLIELLAAIPSVVYGLWGHRRGHSHCAVVGVGTPRGSVGKWLPLFSGPAYGNSLLTASIVLALMILPTITAISRNSLQAVPHVLREGAYSLGATRWETIIGVLLPTAAPGIVRLRDPGDGPGHGRDHGGRDADRKQLPPVVVPPVACRHPGRIAGQSIRRGRGHGHSYADVCRGHPDADGHCS